MGTPDFIAPECLISGVATDHRADLYSVGVMLYNMLTGDIPRGRFKTASEKSGCDPRFDAIINRAMDQEREARYQDALEIRRELEVILATMPSAVSRPSPMCAEGSALVEAPDSLGTAVTLPAMEKKTIPVDSAAGSGQGRLAIDQPKFWIAVALALTAALGAGVYFWMHLR
jgi:serine/threonine protein kinase